MFAGVSKDGRGRILQLGVLTIALVAAAGTTHAADRDRGGRRGQSDDRTERGLVRTPAPQVVDRGGSGSGRGDSWQGGKGVGRGDDGRGDSWQRGGNRGSWGGKGADTRWGVSINIGGSACPPPRPVCPPPVVIAPCPPPVVVAPCPPPVVVVPCPPPRVVVCDRDAWRWRRPVVVHPQVVIERTVVVERPVVVAPSAVQDRELADVYLRMGDFANASRVYERSLHAFGSDGTTHRNLGLALVGDGRAQEGFATFVRGFQVEPGLFQQPISAADFGGAERVQSLLDNAVRGASVSNSAEAWFTVAVLQTAAGDRAVAAQALQRARDAGLSTSLLDNLTLMVSRQTA